jgi:hypothetical protein
MRRKRSRKNIRRRDGTGKRRARGSKIRQRDVFIGTISVVLLRRAIVTIGPKTAAITTDTFCNCELFLS